MHSVEMTVRKMTRQFVRVADDVNAWGGVNIKNGDLVAILKVREPALAPIPSAEIKDSLEGLLGNLFKEPRVQLCRRVQHFPLDDQVSQLDDDFPPGLTFEDNFARARKALLVHHTLYAPFFKALLGPQTWISRSNVPALELHSVGVQAHGFQPIARVVVPTANEYVEKNLELTSSITE